MAIISFPRDIYELEFYYWLKDIRNRKDIHIQNWQLAVERKIDLPESTIKEMLTLFQEFREYRKR